MNKRTMIFCAPVETRSGYGARSRDILKALYLRNDFDIKIISLDWGVTPKDALDLNDNFHNWIKSNIIQFITFQPDFFIQVTVPNEFEPYGKVNIGITAGIETTVAPKSWVDVVIRWIISSLHPIFLVTF